MDFTIDADATIFQFTPLREGRPCPDKGPSFPALFQFTPLREGRREQELHHVATLQFQFTPLREGRHVGLRHQQVAVGISIHAPPRGATSPDNTRPASTAFQFTPLREGRPDRPDRRGRHANFNSRPSARGDATRPPSTTGWTISIHAPPRGATISRSVNKFNEIFQFTPLREGRLLDFVNKLLHILFQFTPLREGRREGIINYVAML